MSRYIDADALIKRIEFCIGKGMGAERAYMFMHMVDDAPTIDIVFCKECTERDDDWCMYFGKMINPDHYCSYGEREGE